MKELNKIIEKYNDIGTKKDLQRNNLTLSAYEILGYHIQDLISKKETETIHTDIFNWFVKFDVKITKKNYKLENSLIKIKR